MTSGKMSHISLVELMSADALMARNETMSKSAVSIDDPRNAARRESMWLLLLAARNQMFVINITAMAAIANSQ